jgi:hypothetical protein
MDRSEMARALSKGRPRQTYVCQVCGKEFETYRRGGQRLARSCSTACRSKAWRIRKRAPQAG